MNENENNYFAAKCSAHYLLDLIQTKTERNEFFNLNLIVKRGYFDKLFLTI